MQKHVDQIDLPRWIKMCVHHFGQQSELGFVFQQTTSNADFSMCVATINRLTICRIIALSPDFNRRQICYIFVKTIVSKMQQSIWLFSCGRISQRCVNANNFFFVSSLCCSAGMIEAALVLFVSVYPISIYHFETIHWGGGGRGWWMGDGPRNGRGVEWMWAVSTRTALLLHNIVHSRSATSVCHCIYVCDMVVRARNTRLHTTHFK